jgi:hypothetical protein
VGGWNWSVAVWAETRATMRKGSVDSLESKSKGIERSNLGAERELWALNRRTELGRVRETLGGYAPREIPDPFGA